MDKEQVIKWLNRLAEATKKLVAIKDFNKTVQLCSLNTRGIKSVPYVQLYSGLHEIAELLEFEAVKDGEDSDYAYYYFMWDGVMFYQLDAKEDN